MPSSRIELDPPPGLLPGLDSTPVAVDPATVKAAGRAARQRSGLRLVALAMVTLLALSMGLALSRHGGSFLAILHGLDPELSPWACAFACVTG